MLNYSRDKGPQEKENWLHGISYCKIPPMTSETGVIKIYLEMDFSMNEFTFATRNFFFIIYLIFFCSCWFL